MNTDKDATATGYRMQAAVVAQIVFSHALALAVAWALILQGPDIHWPRLLLAMGMAGLLGAALTINVPRAVSLVYRALGRLSRALPAAETIVSRLDPLTPLLTQVNELARRDVTSLREALLQQTREAATHEERNRLARELHDSIKQQLFSINVSAAAAVERWAKDPAGAQAALSDVRQDAKEALVEMDSLIQQLSPAPLERVGFAQALREQAESLGYRTGAEVQIELGEVPVDERLPIGAQEAVFRMAQEALSNVARHARARHVTLRLYEQNEVLHLEIGDDGQGFDSGSVSGGMGLTGLRERAQSLGGQVTISSTPGQGARVAVSIPMIDTLQETAENRIDHTYNKLFAVGLGGGLALAGALYYPLYVWLPSQFVAGWLQQSTPFQTADPALAVLSTLAAAAVVVGAGWLAGRWTKAGTRAQLTLFGALAGMLTAIVAFVGVGAGAGGVLGTQAILAHGFRPADNQAQLVQMALDGVLGVFAWNYRFLWGAVLAGAGLGALGGLLSNPRDCRLDLDHLRRGAGWLLVALLAAATLAITLHVVVYAPAERVVQETIANLHVRAAFPASIVSLLPVGSAVITFITALAALYGIQRADARSNDAQRLVAARTSGLMAGIWPLIVMVFVMWFAPSAAYRSSALPVMIAGAAISLLLGGLFIADAVRAGRLLAQRRLTRSPWAQAVGTTLALLLFIVMTMVFFIPGMNGLGRGILNDVAGDLNVDALLINFRLPLLSVDQQLPLIGSLWNFSLFDNYPLLKFLPGLAGIGLAWRLLTTSLVNRQRAVGLVVWSGRRVANTAAGSLLGLLMIGSLATALPSAAGWPIHTIISPAIGYFFFERRGDPPVWNGQEWGALWPKSYYGPGVTDPTEAIVQAITIPEGFPQTKEEVRQQIEQSWWNTSGRVQGAYFEQYNLPGAFFILSLVVAGLIWLGAAGVDALAWRRAKDLSGRMGDRWKSSEAR